MAIKNFIKLVSIAAGITATSFTTYADNTNPSEICFDCKIPDFLYTPIDKNLSQQVLQKFQGKNTELLLPSNLEAFFTDHQRRTLLDRADIIYESYLELKGPQEPTTIIPTGEPTPDVDPKLVNAITPELSCGNQFRACGYVGYKGVEIREADSKINELVDRVNMGAESDQTFQHEMGHNFDLWSKTTVAGSHDMSNFFDVYMRIFFRQDTPDFSPDQYELDGVNLFMSFLENPSHNWETCIKNNACDGFSYQDFWGRQKLQMAYLAGRAATKEALASINEIEFSDIGYLTLEQRADVWTKAFSDARQTNLSCYMDTIRWYLSDELRAEMQEKYGSENPDCVDSDGDTFSKISGDCDDSNSAIFPGAREVLNGLDDNCDTVVDELIEYFETDVGSFSDNFAVSNHSRISGTLNSAGDTDSFAMTLTTTTMSVTLTTPDGLAARAYFYDSNGVYAHALSVNGSDARRSYTWEMPSAGDWTFTVLQEGPGAVAGNYTIEIHDGGDSKFWLNNDAVETSAPTFNGPVITLTADTPDLNSTEIIGTPTHVQFWVSGVGVVATVPYADSVSIDWMAPFHLVPGTYGYRARLLEGDLPASDYSTAHWFDITEKAEYWHINHKATGLRLQSCDTAPGSVVTTKTQSATWHCAQFKLVENGEYFHLQHRYSGLFLAPQNINTGASLLLQPSSWTGDWTQWSLTDRGNGFGHLLNKSAQTHVFLTSGPEGTLPEISPNSWTGDWTQWEFTPAL